MIGGGSLFDFSGATCDLSLLTTSVLFQPVYSYSGPRGEVTELIAEANEGHLLSFASSSVPANESTAVRTYSFSIASYSRSTYTEDDSTVLSHTSTVSTSSDMTVTEQAGRSDRSLSGGTLSISVVEASSQTLGSFSLQPSTQEPVEWSSSCSCPTTGMLEGTFIDNLGDGFTFKVEATAFCGRFRLYVDTSDSNIDIPHCEAL